MKIVLFDLFTDANNRQAGILIKEYPGGYHLKMLSAIRYGERIIVFKSVMKNIDVREFEYAHQTTLEGIGHENS